MVAHNIMIGFKNTGIHPFNPNRALNSINGLPVTPSTPPRILMRTPLGSLASENEEFIEQHPQCNTPVKHRLKTLSTIIEALQAEKTILVKENNECQSVRATQTRPRAGVTVTNMQTHIFSQMEVAKRVAEVEAGQAGKKKAAAERQKANRAKKGKEKAQEDDPELGLLRDDGELDYFDEEVDHGDDDDPTIATGPYGSLMTLTRYAY